jgi:hypothetical protein
MSLLVAWAESMEGDMSEQGARSIVRLMVRRGIAANGTVQNAQLTAWAVEAGLDHALHDDLVSAGELEWIDNGPVDGTTLLTEAGFNVGAR